MNDASLGTLTGEELDAWQRYNAVPEHQDTTDSMHVELSAIARTHAARTAVVAPDGTLSYRDLRQRAIACAQGLVARGVRAGQPVAILADRAVDTYVFIYATVLTGAAYVPIDPRTPAEHIRSMLSRAGVAVLAGRDSEALDVIVSGSSLTAVTVRQLCKNFDPATSWTEPSPDDATALYIIHTSGTTGVAKGVVVPRKGMLNLARWYIARHGVRPGDRLSQNAPATFDPSAQQMFSAWLSGACLTVIPDEVRLDPNELTRWLAVQRVSHLDMVTAHWVNLLGALETNRNPLPDLRWAIVAGETMYYAQCARWFKAMGPNCRLHNIYGPTETTVNATQFEVTPDDTLLFDSSSSKVPIGTPLPGYRVYVTDSEDELCPPEMVGEIVVAGAGVADGYVNEPERTAERFVDILLQGQQRQRVYRTGDLAALTEREPGEWTLEFRGRRDRQIKISGYRVELDAVEGALTRCPGVTGAAVIPRGNPAERLACVFTGTATTNALRAHIDAGLPTHVVLSDLIRVDRLPVTGSGKVDARALVNIVDRRPHLLPGVQAAESTERAITEVWQAELDKPVIPRNERFFAAGGSSLGAIRIVTRLNAHGIDVRAADILGNPTIAECAEIARSRRHCGPPATSLGPPIRHLDGSAGHGRLRQELYEIFDDVKMRNVAPAPVGPLTRARLVRGQADTATAGIWLEFDPPRDPDVIARALGATLAAHVALRTRFQSSPRGESTAEAIEADMTVPVVNLPSDDAAENQKLRDMVAEYVVGADGLAKAVVATTPSGTCHAFMFLPHTFVDGMALTTITAELIDRVRGIAPVPVRDVADSLSRWHKHISIIDSRLVDSTSRIWYAFREADAAQAEWASERSNPGTVDVTTLRPPRLEPHYHVAWLCSVATRGVAAYMGLSRVAVSVVRPPSADLMEPVLPGLVSNMLDAVPMLLNPSDPDIASASDALSSSRRIGHWASLMMDARPELAANWSHGPTPMLGCVRVQQTAGPTAGAAEGIRSHAPGVVPKGQKFSLEIVRPVSGDTATIVIRNLKPEAAEELRACLLSATADLSAPVMVEGDNG